MDSIGQVALCWKSSEGNSEKAFSMLGREIRELRITVVRLEIEAKQIREHLEIFECLCPPDSYRIIESNSPGNNPFERPSTTYLRKRCRDDGFEFATVLRNSRELWINKKYPSLFDSAINHQPTQEN